VRLGGIAGVPTFNRGVADHQYLFVNGRPVKDRLLIGAVRAAYADLLARDRHPLLALFIDLAGRRGRRERPPGQDRGAVPRPALIRGLIVGGLRQALDAAGFRSVQAADAGAMAVGRRAPAPPSHPRESGDPASSFFHPPRQGSWTPAFAGATGGC
jgi:DNA mismatch repair protein MutL